MGNWKRETPFSSNCLKYPGGDFRAQARKRGQRPLPGSAVGAQVLDHLAIVRQAAGRHQVDRAAQFQRLDHAAGKAPRVVLNACNESCLEVLSLDDLKRYAIDLN